MNEASLNSELGEWTRHYDNLLWNVTALFATADGGLLIFCVEKTPQSLIPYVIGLLLPPIAVYFAASFRELKNGLSLRMATAYTDKVFFPRKFWQWEMYVAMFFLLTTAWMSLLLNEINQYFWCGLAGGIFSAVITVSIGRFSRLQTSRVAQRQVSQ